MAKIRDLAIIDIPQINKLMSFVDSAASTFFDGINLPYPFSIICKLLPLPCKFLPETYVLTEKNKILACISAKKAVGNHKKWEISKLLMSNTPYESGLLLLQYIVAKFAAKGVHTFLAAVDETQNELIQLFVDGVGFRQCSRNQLWRCASEFKTGYNLSGFRVRPFKNSDAKNIAELYNDNILPHFRPSLSKTKREFGENIFSGLSHSTEFRYVIEAENNRQKRQIEGYVTIKTTDNKNFVFDCLISKGREELFEQLVHYGYFQAKKRTKDVSFFVVNKYYLQTASYFEEILKNLNFAPSTASVMLVKDLFKTIKTEAQQQKPVFYTDMSSNPAFKSIS